MIIYRLLFLESYDAKIDVDRLAQQSWTEDPSDMHSSGLLEPSIVNPVLTILTAEVADKDIDWDRTHACREEIPWEQEVLLKPNAEIKLVSFNQYDDNFGIGDEIENPILDLGTSRPRLKR